jgi:hypothetical protein
MIDPIVEEIRKIRDEYAARFNYDMDAMVRDLQEQYMRRKLKMASNGPAEPETLSPTTASPPTAPLPHVTPTVAE